MYNAANQVVGWTYGPAGNLTNDGTTTYTFDALNRLTAQGNTTNTYTGDGTLVAQTTGDTTTRFTQDLVSPLSQVLQRTVGSTTTAYVYGHDRLLALDGIVQTWYGSDALGSVRQTLDSSGTPADVLHYDPWGTPQDGAAPPTFGFTGELQDATSGLVYLRARWYQPTHASFLSRDPFAGIPTEPTTLQPYLYAANAPTTLVDPSGRCYGYLDRIRAISFEAEWCRNLDKAVIIYHHPQATFGQKALAFSYAYTWYAGHAIVIGMAIAGGYTAVEAGVRWVMTVGSAWLLSKCALPAGPPPNLPPVPTLPDQAAPPALPINAPDIVPLGDERFKAVWGPMDFAFIEKSNGGVIVEQIRRLEQPKGSGAAMLAAAFRDRSINIPRPSFIQMQNLIINDDLAALDAGVPPRETIVGGLLSRTAAELGGTATHWMKFADRGKWSIQAYISYGGQ